MHTLYIFIKRNGKIAANVAALSNQLFVKAATTSRHGCKLRVALK